MVVLPYRHGELSLSLRQVEMSPQQVEMSHCNSPRRHQQLAVATVAMVPWRVADAAAASCNVAAASS